MWFRSYLSGRTYRVVYACGTSSVVYIVCSVPLSHKAQSLAHTVRNCTWLTLRPLLTDTVSLFTRLPMTRSCNYAFCCHEDITTAATRLKECIVDVGHWMSAKQAHTEHGQD